MKLFVVAFLAVLAVSSAINVGRTKVHSEDGEAKNDPFKTLCNELRSFKASWESQHQRYFDINRNYEVAISKLQKTLGGDATEAEKKITKKKDQADSITDEVGQTNRDIQKQEGTLESVKAEITEADSQQASIAAGLKKELDLAKDQKTKALASIASLRKQDEGIRADLKKTTDELNSCKSEQLAKDAEYQKFLVMSKNTFSVEDRVEKSFAVVKAEIETAEKTVMTQSRKSFNLDTGEMIEEGGSKKVITETYKKVTTGSASVRVELKRETNALTEYLRKTDEKFAQEVSNKQKAAMNDKVAASRKVADKIMTAEIARKRKEFDDANKLRFAGKNLMKAVKDISEHLDSHEKVMNKMYDHYHRFAQARDKASACTAKDCGLMVTHTATAFKVLTTAAAGEFSSMYSELCTQEENVSKNYAILTKLQTLEKQDNELTTIIKKYNEELSKLKINYRTLMTAIENEESRLKVITKRTEEIRISMKKEINKVVILVKESNDQISSLTVSILALGTQMKMVAGKITKCDKAKKQIQAAQDDLFAKAKQIGEITTSSKMSMEVVVEKMGENDDHIQAAANKLNNVIKGFSVMGDKTKFFTRNDFVPGGEKYFRKQK